MNETINATVSAISSMPNFLGVGTVITVVVFLTICATIFLVSKNFKKAVLGGVVTGALLGIFFFSKWVGSSGSSGNFAPLKWTLYIVLFLMASIIIGQILSKNKKINKWLET